MNRFIFFVFIFFFQFNLFSQQGWWTWMHGSNVQSDPGTFGLINVASPVNDPPALYESCEWTDKQGIFWLFGGVTENPAPNNCANALWMFDPATNMWTWKHGSSAAGANGIYGTKGTPAPANTPGARGFGVLTWVDNNGDLWLFGGWGKDIFSATNKTLSDLWKYNIATNQWTWMAGPTIGNTAGTYGVKGTPAPANNPPPRGETCGSWTDNSGNLWLFGGSDGLGPFIYNDLWKFNISTNEWTWMKGANTSASPGSYGTKGTPALSNEPPARQVYDKWKDSNGNLWLFGGMGTTGNYNDLWKYDIGTNMWTWVRGANVAEPPSQYGINCIPTPLIDPPARIESRACWTDSCNNFWLFGGGGTPNFIFNDLWVYNVASNEWTMINGLSLGSYGAQTIPAASNAPIPRYGSIPFIENNGNLWLFGGQGVGVKNYNDMWRFVVDTNCVDVSCYTSGPVPTSSFSGTNLSGCASLTVNFTNTSTNSTNWNWAFGDGNTSTAQHPNNTYTTPGQYTVTLIASDGTTNDTSVTINYVTVYANAVAVFTPTTDTLCIGQSVTFTNSSTNSNGASWNFGDGNTSTSTSPSHTYGAVGNYTVTLIAQNVNGCPDTTTQNIIVTGANITPGNPLILTCTTTTGSINATSTNANATYSWSGPGTITNGTTTNPTVNAAGTYTVTVTDPLTNCTNSATVTVTQNNTPPNASATGTTITSCINSNGTINASSTTTNITYSWSGPGTITNGTTANPTINQTGTYTVTVTDPSNGCTNTATATVNTNTTLPTVIASGTTLTSCINSSGTITANSTTANVNYSWSGPGTITNGTTATPTINATGTYTVTVTDPLTGCTNTTTASVNSNTPLPNVSATPASIPCNQTTTTINATSTTTNATYAWSGTGIISGTTTQTATVNQTGTYTVTVTDPITGCTTSATTSVNTTPGPNAAVSSNITIQQGQSTILTANGGTTYTWFPSTNLNPTAGTTVTATPIQTTIYCVEVKDNNNCKDTACVTVTVEIPCPTNENLQVPNAFSPNEDNLNDEFCLQGWEQCLIEFTVIIFDRWGEKVFESKDPFFCWDGKYLNNVMDAQVFVYYIKAKFIGIDKPIVKEGNISLIR